eukprot:1823348-Pleurochrysis_carterae.AAC.1
MEHEQVIDVASQNELLIWRWSAHGEDARVRRALSKTVLKEPREEGALPTAPSLSHAVHGLLHSADTGSPVGPEGRVSGRRMA